MLNLSKSLPDKFSINKAYPNPFNPTINLSYEVAEANMLTVAVYDVTGRLVLDLVDEVHPPGDYMISWDASSASSGIYFVKYSTPSNTFSQKITLIK